MLGGLEVPNIRNGAGATRSSSGRSPTATTSTNTTTSGGAPNVSVTTNPQPASNAPATATNSRSGNNVTQSRGPSIMPFEDSAIGPSVNPIPDAPRSRLDLDIAFNNTKPINLRGFTEQRPEIIASFGFEPAYDSLNVAGRLTPVAEMLELQMSSRQLRAENIQKLIKELKSDANASKVINELERRLTAVENDIEAEARFLFEMTVRLKAASRALTVKANAAHIRDDVISRGILATEDPVRDVMVNILGFSETGYQSFTDTKILMQLLEDLYNIIKSYSPALINRVDPRRAYDIDPFTINKFTDPSIGVINQFHVSRLKTGTAGEIRTIFQKSGVDSFNRTFRSLSNFDDKLKVILAVLSKELRVSAGLSNTSVRASITQTFGLSDSEIDHDFFDKVIGDPSTSIFEPADAGAVNSLVKLLRVQVGNDTVLPFESNIIKRTVGQTIPGQKFYVDSVLKGVRKFDTTSFTNYASTFGTAAQSLASIIEGTLDVNVVNRDKLGLNADDMMNKFLAVIQAALNEMSTNQAGLSSEYSATSATSRDTFVPALLSAAADDSLLKHMLTLFVVVAGTKEAIRPDSPASIFSIFANSRLGNSNQNQLADIEDAIAAVLPSVANNPVSQYGRGQNYRQTGVDSARLLVSKDVSSPTHGIDVAASAIIARVLDLQADSTATYTNRNNPDFDLHADLRVFDKMSLLGDGDSSYLLKALIDLINSFDTFARNASNERLSYLTSDGKTRFSQFGAHTIVRMIIELFTSFFKAFPIATFAGASTVSTNNGKTIVVARNDVLISELKMALGYLLLPAGLRPATLGNGLFLDAASRESAARAQVIVDRFSSIRTKFFREDDTIKKIVSILLAVGNGLKLESNEMSRFFNQSGMNATKLASLLAVPGSDEKLGGLDEAQVALSRNLISEHKFARRMMISQDDDSSTPFVDDTVVTPSVKAALASMLKSPDFTTPRASNLTVLSVGLPAGFMAALHERVGAFNTGQDFAEYSRQSRLHSDVIKIHVYLKDLLFEDVVFKPKSFIFQSGRFIASHDFNRIRSDDERDFSTLINQIDSRVLSYDASSFLTESLVTRNLAVGAQYDSIFTTPNERFDLISNHVKSYLLGVYLRLLTGIDFAEDNFYLDESIADLRVDAETQALFEKLLTDRVSAFAGRKLTLDELRESNDNVKNLLDRVSSDEVTAGTIDPLGKVLDDASKAVNIELADDLMNFVKVFSSKSILFGAGARRLRVTAPKLFERIFHIPVDPDEFEIDQDLTLATVSGRNFLLSRVANSLIQPVGSSIGADSSRLELKNARPVRFDPVIRRELGNVTLQQYFVVIEQLPELPTIPYVQSQTVARGDPSRNDRRSRHGSSQPYHRTRANDSSTGVDSTYDPTLDPSNY